MAAETNGRLDLGCLLGNIPMTVITRFGTVYQGTILDWDCGRSCSSPEESPEQTGFLSPRSEGYYGFIRMELSCRPGQICCDETPADSPAIVNGIRSSVDPAYPLFEITNMILINWADISAIGPQRNCLTG